MKNEKKIGIFLVALLAVALVFFISNKNKNTNQDETKVDDSEKTLSLKIGAILPLTGDEAMYGEGVKRGMEKAIEIMKEENDIDIQVVYEDSQGNPAKGTTAYKKLTSSDNVDFIVSAYSSVTTPIAKLAEADKMPLLAILASRNDIVEDKQFVNRLFSTAKQQAYTHFRSGLITPDKYKRIAILTTNDAYGTSVTKWLEVVVGEVDGMELVYNGNYDTNEKDFKSILLKIKNENPDVIIQAGTTAQELIEILNDKKEMGWDIPLFETTNTALAEKQFREEAGDSAEGVYTSLIPFDLGTTGADVREKLEGVDFGDIPLWIGATGYDVVNLLTQAVLKDNDKANLSASIRSLGTFDSSNGLIDVGTDGELNYYFSSALVHDGQVEPVEVK